MEPKHPGLESLTEAEAKAKHLGSVRGILWLDRQTAEVVRDVMRVVLKK